MKTWLIRIVVLLVLAIAARYLWDKRAELAPLANNNFKVQGTWYKFEMDRKGFEPYVFTERIISKNDTEFGEYLLRSNNEIEIVTGNYITLYQLTFPDDDHMVWSLEVKGKFVPSKQWKR